MQLGSRETDAAAANAAIVTPASYRTAATDNDEPGPVVVVHVVARVFYSERRSLCVVIVGRGGVQRAAASSLPVAGRRSPKYSMVKSEQPRLASHGRRSMVGGVPAVLTQRTKFDRTYA